MTAKSVTSAVEKVSF